jgi:hypothetical protein
MRDMPDDFGPTALATHSLVQRHDDLIPSVDELLRLETKRVERLHIGGEQLLDPFFAVAGLRPVGRAFAVAELNLRSKALQESLDATLVECLVGVTKPVRVFLEHLRNAT